MSWGAHAPATAKASALFRRVIARKADNKLAYLKDLRLRAFALASEESPIELAPSVPLPSPDEEEEESIAESWARDQFPWLTERIPRDEYKGMEESESESSIKFCSHGDQARPFLSEECITSHYKSNPLLLPWIQAPSAKLENHMIAIETEESFHESSEYGFSRMEHLVSTQLIIDLQLYINHLERSLSIIWRRLRELNNNRNVNDDRYRKGDEDVDITTLMKSQGERSALSQSIAIDEAWPEEEDDWGVPSSFKRSRGQLVAKALGSGETISNHGVNGKGGESVSPKTPVRW